MRISSSNNISMPCDLISHILVRVPVKSLTCFQSLPKSWSHKIKSPVFIKTYHSCQENSSLIIEWSPYDGYLLRHRSNSTWKQTHWAGIPWPQPLLHCQRLQELDLLCKFQNELVVMEWNAAIRQIKRIRILEPNKWSANYYASVSTL